MLKKLGELTRGFKKELFSHPAHYFLLAVTIVFAFFLRTYRLGDLLAFYYDQGRDAKIIWDLWHNGKFFLIGPVTGLAGIFLGPFYYYLIAPFYLIGQGNPVYPSVFLSFLVTLSILLIYFLGKKFHSKEAGLFAAFLATFSRSLVGAGRWLSNPTPLFLTSALLVWSMWEIASGKSKGWWIVASFLIGISLHFEAASAIFYIPMFVVFAIWQRKNLPSLKGFILSGLAFFATLLPQIAFNFRHGNILFNNFVSEFFKKESFSFSLGNMIRERMRFFWGVFYSKLLPDWPIYAGVFSLLSFAALFSEEKEDRTKRAIKLLFIFIGVPLLGYVFYQGNYGNLYDYYLTGYYLPAILLFSLGLALVWRHWFGKIAVAAFLSLFLFKNGTSLWYSLSAGTDGPEHITLGNELQAVSWVFDDAKDRGEFNVDVYVPPVIPHAYDYLFLWQGTRRCGEDLCGLKLEERVDTLYTLYEVDPPHPDRLDAWLERQEGIGEVEQEEGFGGITVQRRRRISDE